MINLGVLEKVAVREAWPGEASDFTPWLSEAKNLSSLGHEIGIQLELKQIEYYVGSYRADILAKRVGSDDLIVIENQFGRTDHGHLGQLLTYAAGVGGEGGARTVVWIAERFSEPHRATLDWLNKCTEPGIGFFGVELQLWRIGDSPSAVKFNVISRPNNWQKKVTHETSGPSETERLYSSFWENFLSFCVQENSTLPLPKSPPDKWWLPMSIGRDGFHVSLNARVKTKDLECQLWIEGTDATAAFSALLLRKDEIVSALGSDVQFEEGGSRRGTIRYKIFQTSPLNVSDLENWPSINRWLRERGETYVGYFGQPLQAMAL